MSPATAGTFREHPGDPHVRRRGDLLAPDGPLPQPAAPVLPRRAADLPGRGAGELLDELLLRGVAVAQLDEPLDNERFVAVGSLLGAAMAETDPAVQGYVDDKVILNLVTGAEATDDVSLQPFAANFLALHSESSGRPVADQPRFIVLMCCEPGVGTAARTVLVPMAAVAGALTPADLVVLARTRYRRNDRGPCICRQAGGRPVFSFRDFASQPLEWRHEGEHPGAHAAADVNGAILALLTAMYEPGIASGVAWRRGMLVIIDNTHFFHGRTASNPATRGRHLKRLRIVGGAPA